MKDLIAKVASMTSKDWEERRCLITGNENLTIDCEANEHEDVCLNCTLPDCDDANPMCALRSEYGLVAEGTSADRWLGRKTEDDRRKIYNLNKQGTVIPVIQEALF